MPLPTRGELPFPLGLVGVALQGIIGHTAICIPIMTLNPHHIMPYAKIAISMRDGSLMVKKMKIKMPSRLPQALHQPILPKEIPTDLFLQENSRTAIAADWFFLTSPLPIPLERFLSQDG